MDKEKQERMVKFLDGSERTIFAELDPENKDESIFRVKNAVVVNIMPQLDPITRQPTGQMALQLIPLFFKEFLGDKTADIYFNYNKSSITVIEFDGGFDFRLYNQYEQMFNPSNIILPPNAGEVTPAAVPPAQPTQEQGEVVKLFEDQE